MLIKPFFGRMLFEADTGASGGNGNGDSGKESTNANAGGQQGEGFKPITSEAELSSWKDGVRKSIAADIRRQLQDEQAAEAAKADEKRKQDEAAARGEFDKVRTELEGKVTSAESERNALKGENDLLTEYFNAQFAAALKDFPESIVAFAPAEDASFADKKAWLVKATEQAAKVGGEAKPGNRPNPKPGTGERTVTKEQQAAVDRQYARW